MPQRAASLVMLACLVIGCAASAEDDDEFLVSEAAVVLTTDQWMTAGGLCLGVERAEPREPLRTLPCEDSDLQRFQEDKSDSGTIMRVKANPDLCLAIDIERSKDKKLGKKVLLKKCDSREASLRWNVRRAKCPMRAGCADWYALASAPYNTCMDIPSGITSEGAVIQQWTCNDFHEAQSFRAVPPK